MGRSTTCAVRRIALSGFPRPEIQSARCSSMNIQCRPVFRPGISPRNAFRRRPSGVIRRNSAASSRLRAFMSVSRLGKPISGNFAHVTENGSYRDCHAMRASGRRHRVRQSPLKRYCLTAYIASETLLPTYRPRSPYRAPNAGIFVLIFPAGLHPPVEPRGFLHCSLRVPSFPVSRLT